MKLIRVTCLLCVLAFLLFITPISSLQLYTGYSSPSQASEQIFIRMAPRKLMIISSKHEDVMKSGAHEGSSEQLRVTSSSGKSKNEDKKLGEGKEEEEKALTKYLSMDYPRFRRRRPVHNKSLRP